MAKLIERNKLEVKGVSDILHISPIVDWNINLGDEGSIDASYLRHIDQGEDVLKELNLHLRAYKKKRGVANTILKYLLYVSQLKGAVSEISLKGFKDTLDINPKITLNTKYQIFGAARAFTQKIMRASIIPESPLIGNFSVPKKINPKKSFSDAIRYGIYDAVENMQEDVNRSMAKFGLKKLDASALVYSKNAIELLHNHALDEIRVWEKDWDYINGIFTSITDKERDKLLSVKNFTLEFGDNRSVEEALKILYVKFGLVIPTSSRWPEGMLSFFNVRGWLISRIKGAFKNSIESQSDNLFVKKIISTVDSKFIEKWKDCSEYTLKSVDQRTVELALKILIVNYGRFLPSSNEWPDSVVDYLKRRGWSASRINAAFFPTIAVIKNFLVASLSHCKLAPNVDTVVYYTYLNSFKPAFEDRCVDVFLGKERGSPVEAVLDKNDPYVKTMIKHVERMRMVLSESKDSQYWLTKERCPLFLIYQPGNVSLKPRLMDSSTVVNIVRRFIKGAADKYPVLGPLVNKVTGENFRPTIALIESLSGKSVYKVKTLLNHKNILTTDGYVDRIETHSTLNRKFMDFQQYIVDQTLAHHERTGNGYICASTEVNNAPPCGELSKCFDCEAKRVVLTSPELAAEWIAWSRHINSSESRLKFNNPARWEFHWLVRLSEYQALIDAAPNQIIAVAKKMASEIKLPFLD